MKKRDGHVVAIRELYGQARRFFGWLKCLLVLRGNLRPEQDKLMQNDIPQMTFVVCPRKLASSLALVVFCLILGHLATQFVTYHTGHDYQLGFARQLSLDQENNIPTWYSSLALLSCAFLLAVIGLAKKRGNDPYTRQWLTLAAIFFFLSMDEAASIHEVTGSLLIPVLKSSGYLNGYLFYPWVIFGTIFVLIVLLAYLPFLADLPPKTRNLFLIAGTLYVGGALGMEILGARHHYLYGRENLTYAMLVTCEEGLEMLGVVLFIYSLSSYLGSSLTEWRILISDGTLKNLPVSALRFNQLSHRIRKLG